MATGALDRFFVRGRPSINRSTLAESGFQAVPVDVPVRWSGFLERGRPRPLNPLGDSTTAKNPP